MKYEVRVKDNNFLINSFKSYKDANKFIMDFCRTTKILSINEIEVVQILSNDDKDKLGDNLINHLKYRMSEQDKYKIYESCYRICDINVIEGYSINEFFIKLLIVDKFHSIMLLSYSVITNEYLKIVDYEQIRYSYFV